jgi:hypothetical protein
MLYGSHWHIAGPYPSHWLCQGALHSFNNCFKNIDNALLDRLGQLIRYTVGTLSNDQIFRLPYNTIIKQLEQWCLSREPSGLAWDYIRELIKLSDTEIKNLHQAWNWIERSLATQCFVFRPTIYGSGEAYATPNKNWSWFPADIDFWDMCDYEVYSEKVIFDDSLVKYQCLKFIANWMGWPNVRPKKK